MRFPLNLFALFAEILRESGMRAAAQQGIAADDRHQAGDRGSMPKPWDDRS